MLAVVTSVVWCSAERWLLVLNKGVHEYAMCSRGYVDMSAGAEARLGDGIRFIPAVCMSFIQTDTCTPTLIVASVNKIRKTSVICHMVSAVCYQQQFQGKDITCLSR